MSSRNSDSSEPSNTSRNRRGRPQMTPFACFVRLRTARACRDDEQVDCLRSIWDNFSDEEREPFETLASLDIPSGSSRNVTREASCENTHRRDIVQEGAPDTHSRRQDDTWGSTMTLVGDDHSPERVSSQESIVTLVDPEETTQIRTFGSIDEETETATVPDDNEITGPLADDFRSTDIIWVYDPESSVRLPGDKAAPTRH